MWSPVSARPDVEFIKQWEVESSRAAEMGRTVLRVLPGSGKRETLPGSGERELPGSGVRWSVAGFQN